MIGTRTKCAVVRGGSWRRLAGLAIAGIALLGASGCSSSSSPGESEVVGVSQDALTLAQIWGFENASGWTVTTGAATKQTSTTHDEGTTSLQLSASSFVAIRADAVAKPSAVSPLLAVDVMIPTQAGPYYLGAIQMSVNAPSLNLYSAWVNQKQLSIPTGVWQTLTFQLPANVYSQLLASQFSDLQISLGLNPPSGVTQPFRFDNLRFLPAPGCVGQPDGTLCDDSVICTTGSSCTAGTCGTASTPPAGGVCDPDDDVLGFENFPAWLATNGSAALAPNPTHVQGVRSLQINTPNFATVSSISLATLHKVSQTLSLRVQKPTNQPNPSWHGDLTLVMAVPSLGINLSVNKPLTGQPNGSFFELQFAVPAATYQSLATHTYNDLTFAISINPPSGQSGFYLLDDLHFVPVASCTGATDKTACEDSSVCTLGDSCRAGVCGSTINCNDNNVCTDDSCNAVTGCVQVPNLASCQDGNACTTADHCAGGTCLPGVPTVCNDSNVCTNDTCNPATGCVFTNNTAPCSDNSVCTSGDVCANGSCVPGPTISCDDSSSCTQDTCDATAGCVHPFACSTGQVCSNKMCCQPLTCQTAGVECGTRPDGCGGVLDCTSICPSGGSCNPAGRCLPPNNFQDKTGINVCETLLNDLQIPEVSHSVFSCNDYSFLECAGLAAIGHYCCVPVACLVDPVCTFESVVVDVAGFTMHAGDLYCSLRSPEEYLQKILNGSISDLEQFATMWTTGGLSVLFDFDVAVMGALGRQVPDNARTIVRNMTQPVYDGGATGFSYADLDGIKIVSSASPTAGTYLPGDRLAITLGPVIVLKSKFYDALFSGTNSQRTYAQLLTDPSVCEAYIGAIDILTHELVHVKQYRELGRYNFTTQYLASALAKGYGGVGFEHEAFEYQIMVNELQGGRYCKVLAATDNQNIASFGLNSPLNTCTPTSPLISQVAACP